MTKDENLIDYEVPSDDRKFYLEIDGKTIFVNEEHYRMYMQPIWAESKRKKRETRCQVSDGRGGVKRCTEDCSDCPFSKSGSTLSIDRLYENYELEIADQSESILDNLVKEEFKKKIWKAVDSLDEINQQIVRLYSEGLSEREIADKVGLSQKAVNKRKTKSFSALREELKKLNI